MKKVFVASHPTEAHLVKGLLDSREIPAIVRGESLFGVRGEAPVTPDTLPSVWVNNDDQAEEAVAAVDVEDLGDGAELVRRVDVAVAERLWIERS